LEELVGRLRHLEPSEPFRSTFQYSNLMYRTAGYLAGQVSGVRWEALTRQRLLEPLGMARTTFSYDAMQRATDYARPYSGGLSTIEAIDYNHDEATSPSGSINSSVSEMTEWVQLFLNDGRHGDTQLIDSTTVAELMRPRIVRDSYLPLQDRSSWLLYALGWNVERWGGHRILFHPGGVEGFTAIVGMMPGREVGWVILTNKGVTSPARFAPFAVQYELIDRVLGRKGPNWNHRILDFYDAQQSGTAEPDASETAPDTTAAPRPSHPLEDYVGQYTNPGYGTFKVAMEGDILTGHYGTLGSTLRHVRYDVFEVHGISPSPLGRPTFKVRFEMGMDGSIDKAAIPLEPAVDPIVFTRTDTKK
jgi:hypothetical protein